METVIVPDLDLLPEAVSITIVITIVEMAMTIVMVVMMAVAAMKTGLG